MLNKAHDVIVRHVRAIIVAVEKQWVLHTLRMCVCMRVCVALGIQHVMRLRHIVICGQPVSTKVFHINDTIFRKKKK